MFKITIPDDVQSTQSSYQLNHLDLIQEIEVTIRNGVDDAFVHWLKFVETEILWISMSNGDLVEYNCSARIFSIVHTADVAIVQACLSRYLCATFSTG